MEDRIAVSRIKQGDLSGLESLVKRYQVQAVQAAYFVVFDRKSAEDIAQAAFVKVIEHIHQFDEERTFAPWFFRIVLNDAIKAAQQQKRSIPFEDEMDETSTHLARLLLDPHPQPEQWLEEKETREHILSAIQSLPPDQRAVVAMRYFLEMSEAEMSEKMERPLSTIKWWLRDARKRLFDLMNPLR